MGWRERLDDEHQELEHKKERLSSFLASEKCLDLPEIELEALRCQYGAMEAYADILRRRLIRAKNTDGMSREDLANCGLLSHFDDEA